MAIARLGWTNLILHTTSFIAERKNRLQTAHALTAIVLVIELIIAELWLAIISLPLYLVTKNVDGKNASTGQYKVRRVITLSVLSVIILIWVLKLVIILLITFAYDPQQAFQVNETNTNIEQSLTITTAIPKAAVDSSLPVPKITEVTGTQGSITIQGEARPNELVVAILAEAADSDTHNPPRLYSGQADNSGRFAISEDKDVFHLPVGDYIVSTVAYDEAREIKSQTSDGVKFNVAEHPAHQTLRLLDQILNILALAFIVIGVGAAVLTL